jgi:hypothetical protein
VLHTRPFDEENNSGFASLPTNDHETFIPPSTRISTPVTYELSDSASKAHPGHDPRSPS